MSNNDNAAGGEKKEEAPIFGKGMTLEKLLDKFGQKLDKEKAKQFEQKFAIKFKELDIAEAIVKAIRKELEKMWTEFNEGL